MEILSNKKILWIIILVLLIVNVASLTTLWIKEWDEVRPAFRTSRLPIGRDHFLKSVLNLSEEQQIQFDTLMSHHRAELQAKVEEIRMLREELMNLMRSQEFSVDSENLVHQIGEKQSELELLNYNHFKEVMEICNDEQKQIFLETLKRAVGPSHRERGPDDRVENKRGRRGFRP